MGQVSHSVGTLATYNHYKNTFSELPRPRLASPQHAVRSKKSENYLKCRYPVKNFSPASHRIQGSSHFNSSSPSLAIRAPGPHGCPHSKFSGHSSRSHPPSLRVVTPAVQSTRHDFSLTDGEAGGETDEAADGWQDSAASQSARGRLRVVSRGHDTDEEGDNRGDGDTAGVVTGGGVDYEEMREGGGGDWGSSSSRRMWGSIGSARGRRVGRRPPNDGKAVAGRGARGDDREREWERGQ